MRDCMVFCVLLVDSGGSYYRARGGRTNLTEAILGKWRSIKWNYKLSRLLKA